MADVYTKDTTIQIKTYNRNSSSDEEYTWSESLDTKMASQKAIKTYVDNVCLLPSDDYDTLTFGTSGSTYTAPANGYFIVKTSTNYIQVENISKPNFNFSSDSGSIIFPVEKNDIIKITYNGTRTSLYFYYSKGGK